MKRHGNLLKTALLCAGLFCLLVSPLAAQRKINIKMASLIPENTPWGAALNRMAGEFAAATNGEVTLQIYHNGIMGGEKEVLRKLKQNAVQAAIFSSLGMGQIAHEVMTLSVPFMIRTDDELDMVLAALKGDLEKKIDGAGFYMLAWARAGWVKIFSKQPVFVPADLKKQKVGTSADELELMQAFKTMGYQMVPVEMNEVLIALNGGMIDAVYQSPVAVGGFQIFGVAKNMCNINVAPFMGGLVMNQRAWRAIPEKYKPKLLEITRRIEKELDTSIIQLESQAVDAMKQYGLVINTPSPAQAQEWYDDTAKAIPQLVGTTFDKTIYDQIQVLLEKYRSGK